MTLFQAIALGCVQGLTEFFPVSSSGHLRLFEEFFDLPSSVTFDIFCHIGTMFSLLFFFGKDLFKMPPSQYLFLFISITPLICITPWHRSITEIYVQSSSLGFCFCVTGLLLFLSNFVRFGTTLPYGAKAFFVGLIQVLALLPGVSRSGSTMAMGRFLGWSLEDAMRYSFLLALPTTFGAIVVQGRSAWMNNSFEEPWWIYLAAASTSFMIGLIALKLLLRFFRNLYVFALYCFCLGLLVIFYGKEF